jgi:Flp pilus assembly protein TadB
MEETIVGLHGVKTGCPDEGTIAAYLGGSMTEWERERLEEHACSCQHCLESIRTSKAGEDLFNRGALAQTGECLRNKAKGLARMDIRKKRFQGYIWLTATVIAFILSFTVPKYFAQFLVASLILGLKWVSESETMRTLIIAMDTKHRHERQGEATARWRR